MASATRRGLGEPLFCRVWPPPPEMMAKPPTYNLEKARARLPRIVSDARDGQPSVILRNGRPMAAVVPVGLLKVCEPPPPAPLRLTSLRGTGKGFWSDTGSEVVDDLRAEWGD